MNQNITFIGCGNMATAMISGILSSGLATPDKIIATDISFQSRTALEAQYGISTTCNNAEAVKEADIVFLAVKPFVLETVISEIKDYVSENTLIVSIAAGKTIASLESMFQKKIKLVRAMPNTPALVGEGMSGLCHNSYVSQEEMEQVISLFQSFGNCQVVPESLMDTVVGISGSSPAYVFLFLEAMADAAVSDGMPRAQAYQFAAQSVLGAAKMVLETKQHPGVLKDAVCSPGGTTIEAVSILEKEGFRSAVIQAQRACVQKSKELGKN